MIPVLEGLKWYLIISIKHDFLHLDIGEAEERKKAVEGACEREKDLLSWWI